MRIIADDILPGKDATMWEIIAEPQEYGIDALIEGMGDQKKPFAPEDREKWAQEIAGFIDRLEGLVERSKAMQRLFTSDVPITATEASLKTLKVQFFKINDALNSAIDIADRLEADIVEA